MWYSFLFLSPAPSPSVYPSLSLFLYRSMCICTYEHPNLFLDPGIAETIASRFASRFSSILHGHMDCVFLIILFLSYQTVVFTLLFTCCFTELWHTITYLYELQCFLTPLHSSSRNLEGPKRNLCLSVFGYICVSTFTDPFTEPSRTFTDLHGMR